jgi:hypothetical protein
MVNAIVCVRHVRSAQRARKASTSWLSSQDALISGGSATLTGKKSGSIKRIAPPGRALATRFSTAIRASATW